MSPLKARKKKLREKKNRAAWQCLLVSVGGKNAGRGAERKADEAGARLDRGSLSTSASPPLREQRPGGRQPKRRNRVRLHQLTCSRNPPAPKGTRRKLVRHNVSCTPDVGCASPPAATVLFPPWVPEAIVAGRGEGSHHHEDCCANSGDGDSRVSAVSSPMV